MQRLVLACTICALTLAACGRKGPLVRAPGTEPTPVVTGTILEGETEPTKPRSTLF